MNGRIRLAVVLALGLATIAAALALIWTEMLWDDSLSRLQQAGVIRIGYAVEPPYAFVKPGGAVTGEAPEIAQVIVARLNLGRIEWRQVQFEELIPELEAGRIDVIAAGMFITQDRSERVVFSQPTFRAQQGLLVAKGNPRHLHSYRDAVAQPDVKLALLAGSVEAVLIRKLGLSAPRRLAVPDAVTGRVAVESGLADGFALSAPSVRWLARHGHLGRTEVAEPFAQIPAADGNAGDSGAFAFRQSDARLLAAWNEALAAFLGSAAHRTLIAEFGFTPAELPLPARQP